MCSDFLKKLTSAVKTAIWLTKVLNVQEQQEENFKQKVE